MARVTTRRRVLVAAALLVGGCAAETVGPDGASNGTTGAAPVPSTTTTTVATLPAAPPFTASPGEVVVEVKQPAADVVQLLSTYAADEAGVDDAKARLATAGFPPVVADQAAALLVPGTASSGEVVYPQLGGLTASRASVMVVVRQRLLAEGVVREVTRTVDVRVDLVGGRWWPVAIASVGGEPVERPADLAPLISALVDHPAVDLPDSARWDLYTGFVDPRLVGLLLDLAKDHELGVTVLASGHPHNVFGTGRTSNHTRGRAVDIWSIDGVPVVDQRGPGSPLQALVQRLAQQGVTELGSPYDLDGPGGAMFTNLVHEDHLHLGYRS